MKAFIGEPADANGNVVPCTYCGRRATWRIGAEPRCSRHLNGAGPLPEREQREVEAARRARKQREGGGAGA